MYMYKIIVDIVKISLKEKSNTQEFYVMRDCPIPKSFT